MFRILLITITMLLFAPSAFSASSIYRDSTVYRGSSVYGSGSSANSVSRPMIGLDIVAVGTRLRFASADEEYAFQTTRLRYGSENDDGGTYGFTLTGGGEDQVDVSGDIFILESSPSLGVYGTIGSPLYLHLGFAAWETIYTNTTDSTTTTQLMSAFEYGVGLKFSLGSGTTVYADYTARNTGMEFFNGLAFTEVENNTGLFSLGLSINF